MEIVERINRAVSDMASKVTFFARPHHYETADGTWLQGVSTVSSIIPKDWLSAWGAKEAVKALGYSDYVGDTSLALETIEKIKQFKTPEEFIEFLKYIKGASSRKSKESLVDGKKGHEWLEIFVKAKIENKELPKVPDGLLERPILQFLDWEKKNIKQWILSESLVAYPEKGYAGTLDGLAITSLDRLAIIDFKFASHISEDYYLQTAGYMATFEPYKITIDDRIIVRLPKTLEKEEWNDKEFKYQKIPNNIEVELIDTDYAFDRDTFFNCLPVKKWINIMEKRKGD